MIRSLATAVLMIPVLSGCATTPEPCTAEWFDWRTERIIGDFVYDHRRQINDLREQAPRIFGPEGGLKQIAPSSMLILTAIGALDLVVDFAGETWPEITDAVAECSSAPDASRLFADMLRREGVDERAVRAIEDLGGLVDLTRGRR
jgi:hypothetical protein